VGGLPLQQPAGLAIFTATRRASSRVIRVIAQLVFAEEDLLPTMKVGCRSATRLRAHRYGSPLIAVAVDPDALVSPMTTWCQLSIGRQPRISRSGRRWMIARGWGWIIPRRWRRRTVRYRATNDRARGDAAENAQAYRAAETARVCINRSKRDETSARGTRERNKRFVHVVPPTGGCRSQTSNERESSNPPNSSPGRVIAQPSSQAKLIFGNNRSYETLT
jgi:hypothetical protein